MGKWIIYWNDIKRVTNGKREPFKKFLSTSKTDDKTDNSHERAISKHEIHNTHKNGWETYLSQKET